MTDSNSNKSKKRTSRRSKAKRPNLDPGYTLKSRRELLDFDYLDKLSEKELDFLDKFTSETINASFDKDDKKNLIKGKAKKREIYGENNARNRCIYTKKKAHNELSWLEDLREEDSSLESIENEIINNLEDSSEEDYNS